MNLEIAFVLAVALAALVLFALDRIRLDQLAMTIPVVLLLAGVIEPVEALSGFSSEATVTVAAMLVLGLGLRKTGLVAAIGVWARTAPLGGKRLRLFLLCLLVAFLSPFLNNTAVVIVFIPVFTALAEQADEPPSLYLMPLSFVAIMGGTVTLIGTATNLVVQGEAVARGYDALTMFSIAPLGLICLAVGMLYLFTIGRSQMPHRERPPDLARRYGARRFTTELKVSAESAADGRTLAELRWSERYDVVVAAIERGDRIISHPAGEGVISAGDRIYVQGSADDLLRLAEQQGLETPEHAHGLVPDAAAAVGDDRTVEMIVGPGSALLGRTLRELNFAQRYDATVIGVQSHGTSVIDGMAQLVFSVGDIILLSGKVAALERLAEEPGFIHMSEVEHRVGNRPRPAFAAAIMAGVVAVASVGLLPISTAAMAGVATMVFTGCVRVPEIYAEMDWLVVFVMAGLIPLGLAMESTGAAAWIATGVVQATAGLGEFGMIAAFYLLTAALTAVVANTATAVMLTPVAIVVADTAGLNPYALLVTVMFGASASFVTPFGYKTNVMIYAPGGYRFIDFVRVGGPLNLLLALVASLCIPLFWPS